MPGNMKYLIILQPIEKYAYAIIVKATSLPRNTADDLMFIINTINFAVAERLADIF